LDLVLQAMTVVFQPMNFILMAVGMIIGIIFGAIPGLTATLAIALLTPFTFNLDAIPALLLLLSIYNGGMYGSSITAITIRTPGAPASAVTVLDGNELAKKGEAGKAIGVSCIAGAIGGLFSAIVMIFLSPPLAQLAVAFSPADYFAVGIFGLTAVFAVSGKSLVKGSIATIFGLLISTIGMDPILPYPRMIFGIGELASGVPFLPAVIGLFAIAEVFRMAASTDTVKDLDMKIGRVLPTMKEFVGTLKETFRGSVIGTLIGILPGAGGTIAAFVAYGESKRASKHPEKYGTGILEGVASPESANNAVTGGAMIPMLTLGIPGDAVTAVLLGALIIQGLEPGPSLFKDHLDVVYPVFAGMILSNIVMTIMGLLVIKPVSVLAMVKKEYLMSIVMIFSIIGAYADGGSLFSVLIAILFGILGYFMEKYNFPVAPVVLALILGPMIENSMRQALIMSQGSWTVFFNGPIRLVIWGLTAVMLITVMYRQYKGKPIPVDD